MTYCEKRPVRDLLKQNPTTYLELLDVFDAYLGTIDAPILRGVELLKERFSDRLNHDERGDINVHVMQPTSDASDMRRRLKQLRSARLTTATVQIEMSLLDARVLAHHLREAASLLYDTADAIDLIRGRLDEQADEMPPGLSGVLALSFRAVADGADRQGAQLRKFANTLEHATTTDHQEEDTE